MYSIRAPSRGSVVASCIILTEAFMEQTTNIGWDKLLRGGVSLKWGKVHVSFKSNGKHSNIDSTVWVKQCMLKVWYHSSSLWKFCNKIVHGATVTKKKEKTPTESCQQRTEENISYEKDLFLIVFPQLKSLFFKKPLMDRL